MCKNTHFSCALKFSLLVLLSVITSPTNSIDISIEIGIGSSPLAPTEPEPEPEPVPAPAPNAKPDCSPPPPPPATPQPFDFLNPSQYLAYKTIQRFKNTITCDPLNVTSTWTGSRPCSYTGFACDTPPGLTNTPKIAAVDFNEFHLCAPTLSNFIDQLPDLAIFHANTNSFSGTIPDLRNLTFLYELDLSNNAFSGDFPSALLPLSQLSFLDLRFNRFSGSVPPKIFKLPLDVLFLNNNAFSQQLPSDLGSVPYLTLANNGFTGPIPGTLCNSSHNLIEVLLLNNKFSGCLPYEIGLLKNATVFDVGFNMVTGQIPLSFGCLRKVEQLNLAGNLLYGRVPNVVCDLAKYGNLVNLSLSGNYFNSLGYRCRELVKSKVVDLKQNCIPGLPNQRSQKECWSFYSNCKYCPFLSFMPCEPPGHGSNEALEKKELGSKSGSVTYNSLHSRHAL